MQAPQVFARLCLKNILFATDFSVASDAAIPHARALARWYGARLFVTHIVPPEPHLAVPVEPVPIDMNRVWENAAGKMESYSAQRLFEQVPHQFLMRRGELKDIIHETICQRNIDLLVLGTHGRHGIGKLALGSRAEQIFRSANCPVLTVGPKAAPWPEELEKLKRIVFATDFSTGSLQALPYALSLAEENQATLSLLHLITLAPMEQDRDAVEEYVRARLQTLVPAEATAWCTPEFIVRYDFPAEGILKVAEEISADLIVMGVHQARFPRLAAHTPWATAYEVVCRAHCPVLTVRSS